MRDIEVGGMLRALRVRRGWTQRQLAVAAGVSQSTVSKAERGRLAELALSTLRRMIEAVEARLELAVRWRGGELDRLVDRRHAALVESTVARLRALGWLVRVEVSYSVFGERGSIDVVAFEPRALALLVAEVKSELTAVETTLRKLDEKVRLAPGVAERLGWSAAVVGRLLVLPATTTSRRRVRQHRATFAAALPMSPAAMRGWLRAPVGGASGVLFVPLSRGRDQRRGTDRGDAGRRGSRTATGQAGERDTARQRPDPAVLAVEAHRPPAPAPSVSAVGNIWRDSRRNGAE